MSRRLDRESPYASWYCDGCTLAWERIALQEVLFDED